MSRPVIAHHLLDSAPVLAGKFIPAFGRGSRLYLETDHSLSCVELQSTKSMVLSDEETTVMVTMQEQYFTDREGKRIGVVLDLEQFQRIIEELEELEDIRAYDAAMASGDEVIPFDQAIAEVDWERERF